MHTSHNKNGGIFTCLPGVTVSTEMKGVNKISALKIAEDRGFSEKSMTLLFVLLDVIFLDFSKSVQGPFENLTLNLHQVIYTLI